MASTRGAIVMSIRAGCFVIAKPAITPVNTSSTAKLLPAHSSANHGLELAALHFSLSRASGIDARA